MISLTPVKRKILALHLTIQMDMKSNDFTHPEVAGRLSAMLNGVKTRPISIEEAKTSFSTPRNFF